MISYRDCAVVYVAWAKRSAEESLVARSVRRVMPEIAILSQNRRSHRGGDRQTVERIQSRDARMRLATDFHR